MPSTACQTLIPLFFGTPCRCEQFLEASKLRYPLDLEPESPVVMIEVALEDSDLNLKKPDKRSFLDKVARNKVAHMLEETNVETYYLTLACGYAKAGDRQDVSECGSQGLGFDDGDYLELMFVMRRSTSPSCLP